MKKSEALMLVSSVGISLLIGLLLIRWLAPGLLGIAPDLQMVRVAKEVPPFFNNIFDRKEHFSKELLVPDPITVHRGNPLFDHRGGMGPHDILGFRNRNVPRYADVVVIGDSQTYGNNAVMELSWPSQLEDLLSEETPIRVYNISIGGWGPLQYLEMVRVAEYLEPQALVVAFYFGNDPLEGFRLAYGSETWRKFRIDPDLSESDLPEVRFPAPPEDHWNAKFADGFTTSFTPAMRFASNLSSPAIDTSHEIIKRVSNDIVQLTSTWQHPPQIYFTVIPTKELVYSKKALTATPPAPDVYWQLVKQETLRIESLQRHVESLEGARFIPQASALQELATNQPDLYPANINGHPNRHGYGAIARTVQKFLGAGLLHANAGLVRIETDDHSTKTHQFALIQDDRYWHLGFPDASPQQRYALAQSSPIVPERILGKLKFYGGLSAEPEHFLRRD